MTINNYPLHQFLNSFVIQRFYNRAMDRLFSDYDNLVESHASRSVSSNSSFHTQTQHYDYLGSTDINNNFISSNKPSSSPASHPRPDQKSQSKCCQQYPSSKCNLSTIASEVLNDANECDDRRTLSSKRSNYACEMLDDSTDVEVPLELAREDIEMVVDVYIWFEKVRSFLLGLLC